MLGAVDDAWSLEGRRIETVTLKETVPTMNIGLGWKKGADHSPAMAAFRSYFKLIFLDASHARGSRVRG